MWVAGWNMPGYLPENDPAEFKTWEEARSYLMSELNTVSDQEDYDDSDGGPTETYMQALRALRELDPNDEGSHVWHAVNYARYQSTPVGGYVYWIEGLADAPTQI
jgi:hypothetical protein